jgi:putative FmdB family regulatory protein
VPTYQYACTVCDHRFEQVQSFSDPSLTVCPECSGKLRKLYGSVGVVFKGSGFYRTDSRSPSKSAETTSTPSASKSSDSTSSTSTKSESSSSTSTTTTSSSTPAAKAS